MLKTIDPEGGEVQYEYDDVGNLLALVDPLLNRSEWVYDDLNRVTEDKNPNGDSRLFAYDEVGNLTSRTDRNGREVERDYDELNRIEEERWLDGAGVAINTVTYAWDSASQLTSIDDAFSDYGFTYDLIGRITQTDSLVTAGLTVALTNTYDDLSRRTGVAASINGVDDFVNQYAFDENGRVVQITQTDGDAANGYVVTNKRIDLSYLADGRFDQIDRYEDLAGVELVASSDYDYDSAGRLIALDHEQGTTVLAAYGWTFDQVGRIIQTVIEKRLGQNLPQNFDIIDKFKDGIGTSIKSMDLGAKTYQNVNGITRVGRGYIDKVAGFQGASRGGVTITASQIRGRALDLAVPPGANSAQQQALQGLVKYGEQHGVTVNIIPIQ